MKRKEEKFTIELTKAEISKICTVMDRFVENLYYTDKEAYQLQEDFEKLKEDVKFK